MAGRFISFEGIDGAGKTTHIAATAEHFSAAGALVVTTREPGGTPLAESVRGLLLAAPMDALTESLLVFAARRDHLRRVIEPALERGDTVLCDRFTDATFAYQGHGHGVDPAVLGTLEGWVHGGLQPDLTLWFDVAVPAAARRRGVRQQADDVAADRFERQGDAFFERVRAGYAQRLAQAPQRVVRIDASVDRDGVWRQVAAVLEQRGW